jgi:hypothetical protein
MKWVQPLAGYCNTASNAGSFSGDYGVIGWHGGPCRYFSNGYKTSYMPGSKTELKDTILIKLESPSIVSTVKTAFQ